MSMQAHKRGSNAPTEHLTSIYADVYPDPVTRGWALIIFITVSDTHLIRVAYRPTMSGRGWISNPQYLRA